MLANIILIVLSLIGSTIFLLMPDPHWRVGTAILLLSWIVYLFFVFPRKPGQTRGTWAFVACFILLTVVASLVTLLYLQSNSITAQFTHENFNLTSYLAARVFSIIIGGGASIILTFLFFVAVGYFSSVYVMAIPDEEGLTFWGAFRSFVSLVFNVQYDWLRVEDGQMIEVQERGYLKSWFSLGKIMIRPGNAIVLQKGGQITRICGPGTVVTERGERIRGNTVYDLRPQFHLGTLENVITADRIPLRLEVGVGYRILPAADPDAPDVIKEKNFNIFPVDRETLQRVAFSFNNWRGLAEGAVMNNLRDQFMARPIDQLFRIYDNQDQPLVNNREIRVIELAAQDAINGIARGNGIEITNVDIRQIILPDDMREAIQMGIKSQAEAEAIQRIEQTRNNTRGELVANILNSIATQTNRPLGDLEYRLATVFAQLTRRALTDDVLGHQYVDMLKALAEGRGTNIFNAAPGAPPIEPDIVLPNLFGQEARQQQNGHN